MGPDTAPDAQYYAEVLQSLRPGTLHSINYHQASLYKVTVLPAAAAAADARVDACAVRQL